MIKTIVRILGFLVAAVMITAVGGFSYLYLRKPAMAPPADVRVEITPARLARGKYLYNLADCDGCHSHSGTSHGLTGRWWRAGAAGEVSSRLIWACPEWWRRATSRPTKRRVSETGPTARRFAQ